MPIDLPHPPVADQHLLMPIDLSVHIWPTTRSADTRSHYQAMSLFILIPIHPSTNSTTPIIPSPTPWQPWPIMLLVLPIHHGSWTVVLSPCNIIIFHYILHTMAPMTL
ncbi:hypothetical protein CK203_104784 [Vitis vinifera]|uniref:Uncharacterized protein n=1 Tax=Vitis vinifera TaxID=29760 RepID=A0A438FHU8_VITVI|nr:hypothetical protein CK203_104784 [Vitis vinifera]